MLPGLMGIAGFFTSSAIGLVSAVIYRSTNSTSLSAGANVPYESELYDDGSYATLGTNADRLTVQNTGLYRAWYQCGHDWVGGTTTKLEVNGGNIPGLGGSKSRNINFLNNGTSAVLGLTAADYVTLEAIGGGIFGYNNDNKYTWLAIERLPDDLSYCLVRKEAAQAATGWGTLAPVTFGTASTIHDPDGYHNETTNNSRLTTLAGQTRVRLSGGVVSNGSAGTGGITFRKNGTGQTLGGTLTPGLPFFLCLGTSDTYRFSTMTPPLVVTGGTDYFELIGMMDSGGFAADDGTFFSIEEVPENIVGCLAYASGAITLTTSYADIPMNTDAYDDASIHDAGSNSADFVVPSGVTRARFHFCAGQNDMCRARALLNGSEIIGGSASSAESGAFWHYGSGRTPWINVVAGDVFKMQAHSDRTAGSVAGCWAALECQ